MKTTRQVRIKAALLTLFMLTFAIVVVAQRASSVVRRINFPRGRTTAVVHGTVRRGVSHDYLLRARRGQTMYVNVAAPGGVSLTIMTPSGRYLAEYVRNWSGYLPQTGDYRISVLPPTEHSRPAKYSLEVTIR